MFLAFLLAVLCVSPDGRNMISLEVVSSATRAVDSVWHDRLGGNPRVKGKRPDIGCYECQDVRGLMLLVR